MISRAALAVVSTALTAGTAACASSSDIAYERATEAVRSEAQHMRGLVEGSVIAGKSQAVVVGLISPDQVLGQRTTSDGFEVDAVFHGKGEAGGAGTYQDRHVRLCARFVVHQRPSPKVELVDTDCTSNDMPIDRTVRLND